MPIINQIVKGGGSSGPSMALPMENSNGKLIHSKTATSILDLTGITDIGDYALTRAYYQNTGISGTVDMSGLTIISGSYGCYSTFCLCPNITGVNLESLQSAAASYCCQDMFASCTGLTNIDLSSLITITATYGCANMFNGCTGLTTVDLSSLATVNGTFGCNTMFQDCTNLTTVDLSSLTTVANSGCREMFKGCTSLTTVDLSSLEFTGSSTYACDSMFYGCTGLTSINLNIVQTRGNYNFQKMFYQCSGLTNVGLDSFVSVGDSYGCTNMFSFCTSLTSIDLSSLIRADGNYAFSSAFAGCTNLANVNLSRLCKLGNSNNLSYMFQNCTALTSLSFPALAHTTNNINGAFTHMLMGCSNVTVHFPSDWETDMANYSWVTNGFSGTNTTVLFDLPPVTTLDFSNIVEIKNIELYNFGYNFTSITGVDLSNLAIITGPGNNPMYGAFTGCTSLTSLSFPSLNTVDHNNAFTNMLTGFTGFTLHFPNNIQTTVQGLVGYPNFGGTSTTVLFDLPATYTLTGADTNIYTRNPKYDTSGALAWKVGAYGTKNFTTPYYTSGLTDPSAGDTIYSDSSCTTVVTTIDSIS